jgi:hypothetical protein
MEAAHERKELMREARDEKQLMLSYPPTKPQSYPWLVIGDGKDQERQTFFSISEECFYPRFIPEMCNKVICTSTNGWLVLKDLNSMNFCLLNPTSKEMVQLPSLDGINDKVICILSSTPSNHNHQSHVVFIDTKASMFYFCRLGDDKFNKQAFETNRPMFFLDATFHGGKIYFLICYGPLFFPLITAEIVDSEIRFTELETEELSNPSPLDIICSVDYLIESCGELLYVHKMLFGLYKRKVYGFLVFRMDFSEKKWVQMKNIGKRTIFLSERRAMCCFVEEKGVQRNSIYFTKADRFLYVFDFEDESISKSLPCSTVAYQGLEHNWVMLS